jgi:putative flippase GtrA
MDSELRRHLGLGSLLARRGQLLRYAGVSMIATATSLTVLGVLVGVAAVGAVAANLIATTVGTVPSFELNRRWVWSRTDKRSVARQVIPFFALSLTGLSLSTLAIRTVSGLAGRRGQLVHTGAVELASLVAYGSLWVVQFVLLDRVLFTRRGHVSVAGVVRGGALAPPVPLDHS